MFKFLKRAKTKREGQYGETVQIAKGLIESQISLSEGKLSDSKIFDVYACGYIFGFSQAFITQAGAEDEMDVKVLITQTLMQIFGNDPGTKIVGRCLRMQSDEEFQRARQRGGSEAMAWLTSGGKDVPRGLTDYLNAKR